jgi:hypothetical protein
MAARPDPKSIADMLGPPESDDGADTGGDTTAAVRDLVKALGLDPAKVDLGAVEEALDSFCAMRG